MKIFTKKLFYLKKTRNSTGFKQNQSGDSLYRSMTGFKLPALFKVLALSLISSPYFAHANALNSNLQAMASSYAQEVGTVTTQDNWNRIEFGATYIDPVVVIEDSVANTNNTYVIGIRNVDAMGFEINLKDCNSSSTNTSVQENVNFSVIDRSQLPPTEDPDAQVTQQFSWGECPSADTTTGVNS